MLGWGWVGLEWIAVWLIACNAYTYVAISLERSLCLYDFWGGWDGFFVYMLLGRSARLQNFFCCF